MSLSYRRQTGRVSLERLTHTANMDQRLNIHSPHFRPKAGADDDQSIPFQLAQRIPDGCPTDSDGILQILCPQR